VQPLEAEKLFESCATPEFNNGLLALVKSRHSLIFISTNEEKRLLSHVENLCTAKEYDGYFWDCYKGLKNISDHKNVDLTGKNDFSNPELTLNYIIKQIEEMQSKNKADKENGKIYVLLDFYRYMSPLAPAIQRRLRYLASECKAASIILTGPSYAKSTAIDKDMASLDFPYPNEYEINEVLNDAVSLIDENSFPDFPDVLSYVDNHRENLINSVKGLTLAEAQSAFFKSMVMANKLGHNPFDLDMLMKEKRSIIRKTDILEYIDPDVSLEDVGGLDNMVDWFTDRKIAFSHEAREYGLNMPKGVMLLGVPGAGKSLTAKAVAKDYGMPLLRLDFGRMFDSFVGESEKTAREAIKLAETIAPCISGSSIVCDINGEPHQVSDLVDDEGKFSSNGMRIYAFNEKSMRMEETAVKAVIKHAKKKPMIRIKTSITSIEVTSDHKIMVNKEGKLNWIEAKDIEKNDLIMTPKYFSRKINKTNWKKAISIPYDNWDNESLHTISAKFGNDYHNITFSSGFNRCILYYLVGAINGGGCLYPDTGEIHFKSNSWEMVYNYCNSMSDMFLIEPSIIRDSTNGYDVIINNKIVCDIIKYANDNLFSQEDEYMKHFLGGVFDSSGEIVLNEEKSKIIFNSNNSCFDSYNNIRKALRVFGIISYRKSIKKSSIIIENAEDIESLAISIDIRVEELQKNLLYISNNGYGKENKDTGYTLGKSLLKERIFIGLTKNDFPFSTQSMTRYEKGSVVPMSKAWVIAETLSNSGGDRDETVIDLICSDLVGMKVTKVEDVGMQYAYDLCCEENHNYVANDILCHNCVLWCDEIEKGLSGGVGQGSGDSGTTKRVISTFLTWLQEKTKPVFVITTANNVLDIPPEFMRAGRFDEVFWIDLPSEYGRSQIFKILLNKKKLNEEDFDIEILSKKTEGYSGAEIEKAIDSGLFISFKDNKRKLNTEDILHSILNMKPLSETRKTELDDMREWAKNRCVFANTKIKTKNTKLKKKDNDESDIQIDMN